MQDLHPVQMLRWCQRAPASQARGSWTVLFPSYLRTGTQTSHNMRSTRKYMWHLTWYCTCTCLTSEHARIVFSCKLLFLLLFFPQAGSQVLHAGLHPVRNARLHPRNVHGLACLSLFFLPSWLPGPTCASSSSSQRPFHPRKVMGWPVYPTCFFSQAGCQVLHAHLHARKVHGQNEAWLFILGNRNIIADGPSKAPYKP